MKNNRLLVIFLSVLMIFTASLIIPHITQAAEADPTIRIMVNGEELKTDTPAVVENDRVLVPFRALFEAIGIDVRWDDSNNSITAETKTKNNKTIKSIYLKIGEKYANTKNSRVKLDVPPVIINERTMIPLRFVAEALDMDVDWNESSRTVIVNNKDLYLDNNGFIIKNQRPSSMKSDLEFTDLKDYSKQCNYVVARGENDKMYIVDKSTLKYRILSNYYNLYEVFYYNNNFYYTDCNDGRNSIKKTDGISDKELISDTYSFEPFIVKNRLYMGLTSSYHKEMNYIDLDTDKVFKLAFSGEYSSILYASENTIFYIDFKGKPDDNGNFKGYTADFHLRIPDKNNSDKDNIIQSVSVNKCTSRYTDPTIMEDCVYSNLVNIGDNNFIFYNLEYGIWRFNPAEKSFKQISDINAVAMSGYYMNNKFYLIRNNEIGFIDVNNNSYSKLFNNPTIFEGCSRNLNWAPKIKAVDEEGNVTFTVQHQRIQQHYDYYEYKYLINENKIELISWIPAIHFDNENPSVPVGTKIDADEVVDTK